MADRPNRLTIVHLNGRDYTVVDPRTPEQIATDLQTLASGVTVLRVVSRTHGLIELSDMTIHGEGLITSAAWPAPTNLLSLRDVQDLGLSSDAWNSRPGRA